MKRQDAGNGMARLKGSTELRQEVLLTCSPTALYVHTEVSPSVHTVDKEVIMSSLEHLPCTWRFDKSLSGNIHLD